MANQHQLRSLWEQLPEDLWGRVFLELDKEVVDRDLNQYHPSLHPEFYGLHSACCVCRRFNNIICNKMSVLNNLILTENTIGEHRTPSLLAYIKKHGAALQRLETRCAPWHDIVLTALQNHPQQSLAIVDFARFSQATISLMTMFKTITTCSLATPNFTFGHTSSRISLEDLEGLPNLTSLELGGGSFTELDAAQHLTKLSLWNAQGHCYVANPACVKSLLHLTLSRSVLTRFHSSGLSACSNLLQLKMDYGSIYDSAESEDDPPENFFCNGSCEIPFSLSNLTALTSLEIACKIDVPDLDFDWLTQLSSLQHLSIGCDSSAGVMVLPNSLTTLSRLTSLCIGNTYNRAAIKCNFDWTPFRLLQHVTFGGNVCFNRSLSELTSLRSLQAVDIMMKNYVHLEGESALFELARLLSQHRSEVLLTSI